MIRKILMWAFIVVSLIFGLITYFSYQDTSDPYVKKCDYTVPTEVIPTFTEASIDFKHEFDGKKTLPFTASAMIDIDNDGIDEVFVGGGIAQEDALFKYVGGNFQNISDQVALNSLKKTNTLGAVSFDLDENGFTDLVLTRKDGIYLLHNNNGRFTSQKLNIQLDEKSTSLSVTLGDYDRDGDVDLFVSAYIQLEKMEGQTIFNEQSYGANSRLFRNDGGLTFTDLTVELGLSYTHNTFQAVFVDVNNDGWQDLVVAYDTGEARIYKNVFGRRFELVSTPMTGRFGYPMGLAVGDYNNDGLVDFFFSNTGTTVPRFLVKGDLRDDQELVTDWILYENQGDFAFTDVAKKAKVADFEFAWGAVFEDFNLDGRQDLAVAENYIAFPSNRLFKLPCRFLLQNEDLTFSAVEEQAGVVNKNFAITPLTSDFNQDGYPDLAYTNLHGPLRIFLSQGGDSHYLKVKLPEQAKNLGSKVVLTKTNGDILTDFYVIGEGLCSDLSNTITFGLGEETTVTKIEVFRPDGTLLSIGNPAVDKTYWMGR